MTARLRDSRRLTGPNLFWEWPGAVLDVATADVPAEILVSAWSEEVSRLMEAVGWDSDRICSRIYDGGVSLVINAPIDVLYAACELNEVALGRALLTLESETPPDFHESLAPLLAMISEEAKPGLLALQSAANSHGVPFLWDDDEVSVGFGETSVTWPADRLPAPADIDWSAIGAIPLGIVTGTNGKSTTVRLAASILAAEGLRAGITSTDYIRVGETILDEGDYSGPGGARTLLRHPLSEVVVLEVARGGLLRRGIGVERADAALITNIAADHLGEWGINSVGEMAEAKFIVRRALSANAPLILNADDPESQRMAEQLNNRIAWFGLDPERPVLGEQLANRREAAFLKDGWLVLAYAGHTRRIVRATDIPVTFGGVARYNIANALGAMLLCKVLGASDEAVGNGLKAFSGDAEVNPGRGNLFEKDGIRIFIDFAHNEHGIRAISDTVNAFNARRNIVLMGQAGDRTDADIGDFVRAACDLNPRPLLVCDLPGYERGRESGVVSGLIREVALESGVADSDIAMFKSPVDGVAHALDRAQQGDCLVLLALTQRDEVLKMVRAFLRRD